MSKSSEIATTFIKKCQFLGWNINIRGSVVSIYRKFTPGSMNEFVDCDTQYYEILSLLPQTSAGSVWGTDGGGVGAVEAMRTGLFRMNKSGVSKRVINSILKQVC